MRKGLEIAYHDTQDVDIFQLARLFEETGSSERAGDTGRLARLVSGSTLVQSAWDGDRLVGFARAISDGVSDAYISDVAVLEDYQRYGIGRELVLRLMRGRDDIHFVLSAPAPLEKYYAEIGFQSCSDVWLRPRKV